MCPLLSYLSSWPALSRLLRSTKSKQFCISFPTVLLPKKGKMSMTCWSPPIPNRPSSLPHLRSHAHYRTQSSHFPPMTFANLRPQPLLRRLSLCRRRLSVSAAAVRQDTTTWISSPLLSVSPAAESLFHVTVDVSDYPDLVTSHTNAGQYLQLKVPTFDKPSFLAIASPPSLAARKGVFEFLVKSIAGSTAELLCGLQKGDVVELSQVMGKGFDMDQISPPDNYQTVLIFATGSGISPIRSLIESGFGVDKRSDVRLYYGARNLNRMAYQDRFDEWESSGVKIVPVLSQPHDTWSGERGYVQAAFTRAKRILNPKSTGAVLCGQKQMAEEVTSLLVADGVSAEKILKNF